MSARFGIAAGRYAAHHCSVVALVRFFARWATWPHGVAADFSVLEGLAFGAPLAQACEGESFETACGSNPHSRNHICSRHRVIEEAEFSALLQFIQRIEEPGHGCAIK